MLAWALRTLLLWVFLGLAGYWAWENWPATGSGDGRPASAASPSRSGTPIPRQPISNQIVYRADSRGHFYVTAAVNGVPIRFIVDTGASYVALTAADAEAAGISRSSLRFNIPMSTANGTAYAAATMLREVRLEQFSVPDVQAVVHGHGLGISLLGMSFLRRLDGYEIQSDRLVIRW
jgi:aspartyl protease family protein